MKSQLFSGGASSQHQQESQGGNIYESRRGTSPPIIPLAQNSDSLNCQSQQKQSMGIPPLNLTQKMPALQQQLTAEGGSGIGFINSNNNRFAQKAVADDSPTQFERNDHITFKHNGGGGSSSTHKKKQWSQRNSQVRSFWSNPNAAQIDSPGQPVGEMTNLISNRYNNSMRVRMSQNGARMETIQSNQSNRTQVVNNLNRLQSRRESKGNQQDGEYSQPFSSQRSTRQIMDMAYQQKYILNALFKKNQLYQERERQANNIKLGSTDDSNQNRQGTAAQKVEQLSGQESKKEVNFPSPESWRHFKHNSLHLESYSKNKGGAGTIIPSTFQTPTAAQNMVMSPLRSSVNGSQFNNNNPVRLFSPANSLIDASERHSQRLGAFEGDVNKQQFNLIDKELEQMVQSMKMLDPKSLNPNQQKTLKEIEDHLAPEVIQDMALRERNFRHMLTEIKLKSENMRRRKLNQAPSTKLHPPAKGQPSFITAKDSQSELEHILKLKVDQTVIREFLGAQQNPIGDSLPQTEKQSPASNQYKSAPVANKSKFDEPKEIKINLIEEYKSHLSAVSKMSNFNSMKMYMDHNFFKVYMPLEILENQGTAFENEIDDKQDTSLRSTVLPSVFSFLEPQQEALIPTETQSYQSTTTQFSLLLEMKQFMRDQILARDILMGKDESLEVNLRNLRSFYQNVFQMVSELMRIQSREQNDIASSLIVDHLFKIMMIKVDEILCNNNRIIQKAIEDQKYIVRQMKKEMEEELEKRDDKMQRVENDFKQKYNELQQKFEKAQYDSLLFQELFQETKSELVGLTTLDNRFEHYENLKNSFSQINRFISEAEDEKIKQMKVLDQFSKLIDIGTKKGVKATTSTQSDLCLSLLYPHTLTKAGHYTPESHSCSEFIQLSCLESEVNKEKSRILQPDKLASIFEMVFDSYSSSQLPRQLGLQTLLARSIVTNPSCTKIEGLAQTVHDIFLSLQHHINDSAYARFIYQIMQFDQRLKSQALVPYFLKERTKYLDFLKQNFFKATLWSDAYLFLTVPFNRIVQFMRQNFRECRELGEYFFELAFEALDVEGMYSIININSIGLTGTLDPQIEARLSPRFFKRCSYILYMMYAQMQALGASNPPHKAIVDHFNFLIETGRVNGEKVYDEMQQAMRKLNLWVSPNDLKCLIFLMDPLNTGQPKLELLIALLEKQKAMQDFLQVTQFTVSNYFHVCLGALEMNVELAKESIVKFLEAYAESHDQDSEKYFLNYHTYENALKSGYSGAITDEEIFKAYCDFLINSKASLEFGSLKACERISRCVLSTVENIGSWLQNTSGGKR